MMAGLGANRPPWLRLSGIGVEFAAAVGGLAMLGYWVDRHYHTSPWGVLIGFVLGLTGATYNLIKASMSAFKRDQRTKDDGPSGREDSQ